MSAAVASDFNNVLLETIKLIRFARLVVTYADNISFCLWFMPCHRSHDASPVFLQQFLPARRYASAGNSDRNVSVRPSVRLSRVGIVSKRRKLAA